MSYNIDRFVVKETNKFKLNECPDIDEPENFAIELDDDGNIESLSYSGEHSGYGWDVFYKILKNSTGYLRAIIVWEGGDSVIDLTILDGIATETKLI